MEKIPTVYLHAWSHRRLRWCSGLHAPGVTRVVRRKHFSFHAAILFPENTATSNLIPCIPVSLKRLRGTDYTSVLRRDRPGSHLRRRYRCCHDGPQRESCVRGRMEGMLYVAPLIERRCRLVLRTLSVSCSLMSEQKRFLSVRGEPLLRNERGQTDVISIPNAKAVKRESGMD